MLHSSLQTRPVMPPLVQNSTLGEAVLRAQAALGDMWGAEGLRAAAQCLASYMKRGNWQVVLPAGPDAGPMIAAALVLAGPPSHVIRQCPEEADHVLVVEAVAISGFTVRRAIGAARAAKVPRIGLFVWREELVEGRDGVSACAGVDEVFVAH